MAELHQHAAGICPLLSGCRRVQCLSPAVPTARRLRRESLKALVVAHDAPPVVPLEMQLAAGSWLHGPAPPIVDPNPGTELHQRGQRP